MLWCIGASSGWGVGCWELITHKDGARKVKARVVRGGLKCYNSRPLPNSARSLAVRPWRTHDGISRGRGMNAAAPDDGMDNEERRKEERNATIGWQGTERGGGPPVGGGQG